MATHHVCRCPPDRPPNRPVNNRQYTHKHHAYLTIGSYRGEFTYNAIDNVTTMQLCLRPFGTTFSFVFPCSRISQQWFRNIKHRNVSSSLEISRHPVHADSVCLLILRALQMFVLLLLLIIGLTCTSVVRNYSVSRIERQQLHLCLCHSETLLISANPPLY